LSEAFVRFLIGGLFVSAFASIGGLFKPTSFGGLFGAAPSVALATLALTISKDGKAYVAHGMPLDDGGRMPWEPPWEESVLWPSRASAGG
jgi:hypothetical protein